MERECAVCGRLIGAKEKTFGVVSVTLPKNARICQKCFKQAEKELRKQETQEFHVPTG